VINFGGTAEEFPNNGLIKDSKGNAYGTTVFGGDLTCHAVSSGYGVVFKIDRSGKEGVLCSFLGPPDGHQPTPGLVLDKSGISMVSLPTVELENVKICLHKAVE